MNIKGYLASVLMTLGGFVAILSGGCSYALLGPKVIYMYTDPSLNLVGAIGGIPFAIGLILFILGLILGFIAERKK